MRVLYRLFSIHCFLVFLTITAAGQVVEIPHIVGIAFEKTSNDYSRTLTNPFTVYELNFHPDSLFLHWDASASTFSVTGKSAVSVFDDTLRVTSETGPVVGIEIENDELSNLSFSIYQDFTISGLTYEVDQSGLPVVAYSEDESNLVIWGPADVEVDGERFEGGSFGELADAGVVFNNGYFDTFKYFLATGLLDLYGMELNNPNMTLQLVTNDLGFKGSRYIGYGDVEWVVVDAGFYAAGLGSHDNPSIRINDGKFDTLQVNIVGGALLFGALPTIGDIQLRHDKVTGTYRVKGTIVAGVPFGGVVKALGAKYAPSVTIDAENGGIVYHTDTKKLHVDDASFKLGNIPLGTLSLKEFTIGVKDNELSEASAGIKFPEGFILDGDFLFDTDPFRFNGFDVQWNAVKFEDAIIMPGTGFEIVHMEVGARNLDQVSNLTMSGSMGFVYGQPFEIEVYAGDKFLGAKEVSTFYIEGDVTSTPSELKLEVDALLGALQEGVDWKGFLGEGTASVTLKYGVEYDLEGTLKLPVDPLLEADVLMEFAANGDFLAEANVTLEIPREIPIIGGKRLGNAEGVIRSINHKPNQSYAAAWTKINFGFGKHAIGGKVNFGNGKFKSLGSRGIHDIEDDVKEFNQADRPKACTWYKGFSIDDQDILPYYLQLDIKVTNKNEVILSEGLSIRVESPDGSQEHMWLEEVVFNTDGELERVDASDWASYIHLPSNRDSVFAVAGRHEAIQYSDDGDGELDPRMSLSTGYYNLVLSAQCAEGGSHTAADQFDIDINYIYPPPTVSVSNQQGFQRVDFRSHFIDSTTISVYQNLQPNTANGTRVAEYDYPRNADGPFFNTFQLDPGIVSQPYMYYYGVVDDNLHAPVYSAIDSVALSADLKIMLDGPAVDSVLVVLTDVENGEQVTHQMYMRGNSEAWFYNVPDGNYAMDVYLPSTGDPDTEYAFNTRDYGSNMGITNPDIGRPDWMHISRILKQGMTIMIIGLQETSSQLYGQVVDQDGNPIPGAAVALLDQNGDSLDATATTDAGYSFFDYLVGDYTLKVTLPEGYHWNLGQITSDNPGVAEFSLEFDGQERVHQDIVAHGGGYALYGRVYDTGTGAGLAGSAVTISFSDTIFGELRHFQYTAHTNKDGYYFYKAGVIAVDRNYSVSVRKADFATVGSDLMVDYGSGPLKYDIPMRKR